MRSLRSFVHTASITHLCDDCRWWIEPGDRYEGTVYAYGDGLLVTMKKHLDPQCPDDDWEDELDEEDQEGGDASYLYQDAA